EARAGEPPAGPEIAPETRPEGLADADGGDGPGPTEAPATAPAAGDASAEAEAPAAAEALAEAGAAAEAEEGDRPEAAALARTHLLVHAPPGVSDEALAAAVAGLAAEGYRIDDIVRVDLRILQTNVRYFHPQDAEIAGGVAGALAGVARDFTAYRP